MRGPEHLSPADIRYADTVIAIQRFRRLVQAGIPETIEGPDVDAQKAVVNASESLLFAETLPLRIAPFDFTTSEEERFTARLTLTTNVARNYLDDVSAVIRILAGTRSFARLRRRNTRSRCMQTETTASRLACALESWPAGEYRMLGGAFCEDPDPERSILYEEEWMNGFGSKDTLVAGLRRLAEAASRVLHSLEGTMKDRDRLQWLGAQAMLGAWNMAALARPSLTRDAEQGFVDPFFDSLGHASDILSNRFKLRLRLEQCAARLVASARERPKQSRGALGSGRVRKQGTKAKRS